MPPSGQTTVNRGHIWSKYEVSSLTYGSYTTSHKVAQLDILMCLMARGVHRGGVSGSHVLTDDEKRVAHRDVHRRLNREAHLNNRARYVSLAEVTTMIDRVLAEQSGIVGVNGFIETATPNRVTRGLRSVWGRATRTMARDNQFAITYQQRKSTRPIYAFAVRKTNLSKARRLRGQELLVLCSGPLNSTSTTKTTKSSGIVQSRATEPSLLCVETAMFLLKLKLPVCSLLIVH